MLTQRLATKPNKTDRYLIVLFFAIAVPISLFDMFAYEQPWEIVGETAVYVIVTFVTVYLITYRIFPLYFAERRYFIMLVMTLGLMLVMGYLMLWANKIIAAKDWNMFNPLILYYAFLSITENIGLLLGILLGKKFFEANLNLQRLEKEKRENELRVLKAQIDPHFLFNNLNTIDALIDSDPKAAKTYLHKLSSLYRYLIQHRDEEVVPLSEELAFGAHYQYLINARFGGAYSFRMEQAADAGLGKLIPPGALQAAYENAVKHNLGLPEQPTLITTRIEGDQILVTNSLRPRPDKPHSTKAGLSNLQARYQLISNRLPKVEKTAAQFSLTLPLLNASMD